MSPEMERLIALESKVAFLKGVLVGLVLALVFALGVFAIPARADTIPDDAYHYRSQVIRYGRLVWGMDAPTASFAAQIHQESRWRADARSIAGAQGIAQFMPSTSRWIAGVYPADLSGADPYNPDWGIRALIRYDRNLWEQFRVADPCQHMAFALSSYNGGVGWAKRRQRMSVSPNDCLNVTCRINPGVSADSQRENEGYPRRILLMFEPVYVRAGFGLGACR